MLGAILNGTEIQNSSTDYVTSYQIPTAENNYTWYRKYKSGWVEQGGFCSGTAGVYTVNLPVEMADGNYATVGTYINPNGVNNTTVYSVRFFVRNTNSFTCDLIYDNGSGQNRTNEQFNWQVSGMTYQAPDTVSLQFTTIGVPMIDSYTIDGVTYTGTNTITVSTNTTHNLSAVCHGNQLYVNGTGMRTVSGGTEPWTLDCTFITDGIDVTFTGNYSSKTISVNTTVSLQSMSSCCVPYYTDVNCYNNTTKKAEAVVVGDKLLGYNEKTKEFEEVEVLNVIHKIRDELVTIKTENYEIEITPDHPILTDQGWAVYDLTVGNYTNVDKIQLSDNLKVLTKDGTYEQIESVEYRKLEEPIDMFTFDVTDPIDTYVAAGLISHNEKC